jgi:hypothetical protein
VVAEVVAEVEAEVDAEVEAEEVADDVAVEVTVVLGLVTSHPKVPLLNLEMTSLSKSMAASHSVPLTLLILMSENVQPNSKLVPGNSVYSWSKAVSLLVV